RYIHLSYPPDAPQIVSVTQVDDALQFELGADGATSYRVYYDTDAGVPYNGAGALEGQSPVFFNAWDDIKLTGLAPGMQWYIAIKAVNSAGESPISNEYLYTPANTSAIIDQNISWTNNLTLTHPVDIVSSGRLSIDPNVVITLADEGRIICQAGGVLQLDNYVTIKGQRLTIPQDETNPQEIPGNRVEVHGGLISGTGVSFDSFEGNYWDGLYIDSPYTVVLNQMSFNNCRLVKEQETISINNSVFDNASISCRNASLIVDNCQISGEVYCLNSENINISNTSVTGYGNGIELSECTNYEISNCQITNNTGNGINVYETNGAYNVIQRCTISMNAGDGIKFYHANGNVISCTINGNNKGVVVFQNSVVNINKEPSTDPNMYDSYISNNTWQEILFTDNCNVIMDGGWNQIIDMQYTHGTFDQYLVQCPNLNHSIYFRENYWGYHNSNVNEEPIIPPSERFFPENIISDEGEPGYILDPVWSPGLPHIITDENDELIYQQAIDLAVAEDVEGAIYLFKQIISLYPDSKLLDACAKNLYALEQDKQALKDYYHTEPNLHWNGEIDKIADYLETYCNIKLGNYQEAIAWFEAIISNPPSELDSLMAVIDLGYTYVLMQENAPKTAVTRMYPSLQPRSRKSFEQNRDALLVCLYTGATGNELPDTNFDNGIAVPMLNNCYPNPFNPTTTISYLLPYEMPCDLSIYNIRGQKVKTLVTDMQPAGLHKVVWDGTDRNGRIVSSGIYLYRLTSPVKSITNKMIMLK
ncbi:MAG: right-handed parallel beta-helix repeat-containing protein, partial [Candidatus Cloacimonas sp.]|nr:right-handed parallel beta-helix repeat-containing protein [Candidatus Cloacimonas sp.]